MISTSRAAASLCDALCLARLLLSTPQANRASQSTLALNKAQVAHDYYVQFGKPHPELGDGSLMAACIQGNVLPEPTRLTSDYVECLLLAFQAIKKCAEGDQPAENAKHTVTAGMTLTKTPYHRRDGLRQL